MIRLILPSISEVFLIVLATNFFHMDLNSSIKAGSRGISLAAICAQVSAVSRSINSARYSSKWKFAKIFSVGSDAYFLR